MKAKKFIPLVGTLAAALPQLMSAQQAEKPNILLILVDDMGYKDTGFTGSDFYETPVIDSLANRAMRFTNAYACAGNSAPSRACLISGQYTPRHGIFAVWSTERGDKEQMRLIPHPNAPHERLPITNYTLADAMKGAGYTTAMVGKWHLGNGKGYVPEDRGFDVAHPDKSPDKKEFARTNDPKNIFKEVGHMCDFMEQSVKSGKPFFGYLPFHAIHQAWQARQETLEYFQNKPKGNIHTNALLAGTIKNMDEGVGILMRKIRDLGIADNTVIIFTSDNGGLPGSPQTPLRSYKGTFYEGGVRVPFFIHYPGKIKPGDNHTPIANIDIYPTCLEISGRSKPEGKLLDGKSLVPVLYGKAKTLDRPALFWHFPGYLDKPYPQSRESTYFRQRPSSMIRKGDWKLILYYEEWLLDGGKDKLDTNNAVELFNLINDLSETRNVANTHKAKRDELLADLLRWIDETNAPLPEIPDRERSKRGK